MVDGVDRGQAVNLPQPLPSNTSGSNANTDITGTIDYANARYKTTYTNKTAAQKVQLKKSATRARQPLPALNSPSIRMAAPMPTRNCLRKPA